MNLHLLMLGLLFASSVSAQEQVPRAWSVRVDVQMVALPMAEAVRLLPHLRRAKTFVEADRRLQTLVDDGIAEVLGWPIAQGVNGEKSVSESIDEIRFGTAFEPPAIAGSWSSSHPVPLTPFEFWRHAGAFIGDTTVGIRTHDVPTAFDSRETGPILEIEPQVTNQNGDLSLSIRAQWIHLDSMEPAIGARSPRPEDHRVVQPRITNLTTDANLTLANGGRILLDSFVLEQPQPRVVLFLLHASAQRIAPAQP